MLLHQYLIGSAQTHPEKIAIVSGDVRKTYSELHRASSAFASYLLSSGLKRGDRVAVYMDNSIEVVAAIFGILEAGGCMVVVNPATQADRLTQILENCTPRFLLTVPDKAGVLNLALPKLPQPLSIISAGGPVSGFASTSFESASTGQPIVARPFLVDTDLAGIIYTSGSTGRPKGVTHLHQSIDIAVDSIVEYLGNNSDDVILAVLPLSSSYGLLQILATFRTGGRVILEKGLGFPYELINRIKKERVTGFAGAPTIWAILLKLEGLDKEDFSFLRYITNAAAALPASFIPRLRKVFPQTRIYPMHGLTECLRTTYLPPEEVETKPTSVGKGMRNVELWVEDADGRRLPPGEVGEMIVRGPTIMAGYWNDPEGTAKALIPGPYPWERVLRTRDLFMMDTDGYFHFVARSDELIKSRGEKVSPIEVEDILYLLEGVHEVRVIGIPHDIFGQAIQAEIVLKEGFVLSDLEVKAHCRKLLEDFKVPQNVLFVSSLPKTAGGKIKRTA